MLGCMARNILKCSNNIRNTPKTRLGILQNQRRFDSGVGNIQIKNVEVLRRYERVSEILSKVKERDGLQANPSHVEHLVGSVSNTPSSNDLNSSGNKEMMGLDLSDKTQFILESAHPVRYFLEREIHNHSKHMINYHHWITLFGRGIQLSHDPRYEEMLHFTAKASDIGMFSSDIHQSVADVPEEFELDSHNQFRLGNKYAILVGDYFAIKCIFYAAKIKKSQAFMAVIKGVEEFSTASFAVQLFDPIISYPVVPNNKATVNDWIRYNKKASGYFNGGLYAVLLLNHGGLPKNEEFMKQFKTFSSNLSVFLKGMAEIDALENAHDFSTVYPLALTSLPAILYQQKHPGAFDSLRQNVFKLNTEDLKQLSEEIEKSSAMNEAKFILGEMASEVKRSYEKIATVPFYSDVVQDLIETISTFDS